MRQQQQQGHTHVHTPQPDKISTIQTATAPQKNTGLHSADCEITPTPQNRQARCSAVCSISAMLLLPTTTCHTLTPGQHILCQPRVTRHHVASSVPHRPQLPGPVEARQNVLWVHSSTDTGTTAASSSEFNSSSQGSESKTAVTSSCEQRHGSRTDQKALLLGLHICRSFGCMCAEPGQQECKAFERGKIACLPGPLSRPQAPP